MLRVVGGRLRGRKLAVPDGEAVRPTAERAREALFNILMHGALDQTALSGSVFLDAFAGSGAVGIEALSRGAARAYLLDRDPRPASSNAAALGLRSDEAIAVRADATRPPRCPGPPASLGFVDPPYGEDLVAVALDRLAATGWLTAGAVVAAEFGPDDVLHPPDGFAVVDERRYGKARLTFLRFRDG